MIAQTVQPKKCCIKSMNMRSHNLKIEIKEMIEGMDELDENFSPHWQRGYRMCKIDILDIIKKLDNLGK